MRRPFLSFHKHLLERRPIGLAATATAFVLNQTARQVAGQDGPSPHLERFLSDLEAQIDWRALDEASLAAADHILDNRQQITSWIVRLVKRRLNGKNEKR